MMASPPVRNLSGSGAAWRALRGGRGITTEGGQDKRAHIARRPDGCFCVVFWPVANISQLCRNVPQWPNTLPLQDFLNITELRHGG